MANIYHYQLPSHFLKAGDWVRIYSNQTKIDISPSFLFESLCLNPSFPVTQWGNCRMASFYYYYQNPSVFCFLVQIRTFVF